MDKIENVIDKKTKNHLIEYLLIVSRHADIEIDVAYRLAIDAIKYYRGNNELKEQIRYLQELETRWYESLKNKTPDYTVYNDNYIFCDLWACWVVYSRNYLLGINSEKSLGTCDSHNNWYNLKSIVTDIGNVSNIVDLGCGIGYTTATLRELFPNSNIYGTNLSDTKQYLVASEIGKTYGFKLIPSIKSLNTKIDFIFASEYFEHIEKPIEHLIEIINTCEPRVLIIANAFNSVSLGHFNKYIHNEEYFDGKTISRKFNKTLRDYGYEKIETKLWNDRPSYWKKREITIL